MDWKALKTRWMMLLARMGHASVDKWDGRVSVWMEVDFDFEAAMVQVVVREDYTMSQDPDVLQARYRRICSHLRPYRFELWG